MHVCTTVATVLAASESVHPTTLLLGCAFCFLVANLAWRALATLRSNFLPSRFSTPDQLIATFQDGLSQLPSQLQARLRHSQEGEPDNSMLGDLVEDLTGGGRASGCGGRVPAVQPRSTDSAHGEPRLEIRRVRFFFDT